MQWARITPFGDRQCASQNCGRSARWHFQRGDIGSDYCSTCREAIEHESIEERLDRLEIALHRIVGHGNITIEKAKAIAAEALANK